MALIRSFKLTSADINAELIAQGRYSIQKLLTNSVIKYYKTVEYNNGDLPPSQYLISKPVSNIDSIYLYCTGFVRKYQLPQVSTSYQEYLIVYIADNQNSYYLFQVEFKTQQAYQNYKVLPEGYEEYRAKESEITGEEEDVLCTFVQENLNSEYTNANDGSALLISANHQFDTIAERNDYFDRNPEDLVVTPLYCLVAGQIYLYDQKLERWNEVTSVFVGPKGSTGLSAKVSVGDTTTGLPGTQASVVMTGSQTNAKFYFTIPEGIGAQLHPKGEYDGSVEYSVNDVVIGPDNNTYLCILQGQGYPVSDSTHWSLLINKGQKGDTGDNGQDGLTPYIDSESKNWIIGETDTGVCAKGEIGSHWLFTSSPISKTVTQVPLNTIESQAVRIGDILISQNPSSFNTCGTVNSVTSDYAVVTFSGSLAGVSSIVKNFERSTYYGQYSMVLYDGLLYRAKRSFTSGVMFDYNDWDELKTKYIAIVNEFSEGTEYSYHELMTYDNALYRSLTAGLIQNTFSLTGLITYWKLFIDVQAWSSSTEYTMGELRSIQLSQSSTGMDGVIQCITPHTSGEFFDLVEAGYWQVVSGEDESGESGTDYLYDSWQPNKKYKVSSVVEYNYKLYECITPVSSSTFILSEQGTVWEKLSNIGDFLPITGGIITGDIIRSKNSNTYKLLDTSDKAVANGVASLDANTKIPATQLPVMVGSDGINAGTSGAVPQPLATDNIKYLRGNGTYSLVSYTDLTNKPTFATVATSGDYNDLSNKPSIPAAASDMTGADGTNAGTHGLVPAPAAADNTKFLKGDGTWSDLTGVVKSNVIKNIEIVTESEYDTMKQAGTLVATTWYLITEDESGESGL